MQTIYKYPLPVLDSVITLSLPKKARILSVQVQAGAAERDTDNTQIWAEVHAGNELEVRRIYVVGTGHEMPPLVRPRHIGTVQYQGGGLVFHFFEERRNF